MFIIKETNLVTPLYEFLQMVIHKKHEIDGKEKMEGVFSTSQAIRLFNDSQDQRLVYKI